MIVIGDVGGEQSDGMVDRGARLKRFAKGLFGLIKLLLCSVERTKRDMRRHGIGINGQRLLEIG